MIHTKFHYNQLTGSWEDFKRVLTYMGMAAILGMWSNSYQLIFIFLFLKKKSYEI